MTEARTSPPTPLVLSIMAMLLLITSIVFAEEPRAATRVETLAQLEGGTGGLSIDAQGNLYSSEFGDSLGGPSGGTRVFQITPSGETRVFAEGLQGASGSELDSEGNLYQSNIRNGTVSRIDRGGTVTTFTTEGLVNPVGIATGKDGALYVADCGANAIVRVDSTGNTEALTRDSLLRCPNGITTDQAGNFYVANFYDGNVLKVDAQGNTSELVTLPGNNNGHLIFLRDALYVVGRSAHQIFRVTLDGEFEVFAGSGDKGGRDGSPEEASFCYPNDIAASPDGRYLYVNEVADESSDGSDLEPTRIRRITFE